MKEYFNKLPNDLLHFKLYVVIVAFLILSGIYLSYSAFAPQYPIIKEQSETLEFEIDKIKEMLKNRRKEFVPAIVFEIVLQVPLYYSISRYFMNGRMDWIYEVPCLTSLMYISMADCLPHNLLRFHFILKQEERKMKK